jgi:hypothetical protein
MSEVKSSPDSIRFHAHRFNADLAFAADLALGAKNPQAMSETQARQALIEIGHICQRIVKELEQDVLNDRWSPMP